MKSLIVVSLVSFLTISIGWSSIIVENKDYVNLCQLFNQLIDSGLNPADAVNQVAQEFISHLLTSGDQSTINFPGDLARSSFPGHLSLVNETANAYDFLFGSLTHFLNYLLTINSDGEIIDSVDSDVIIVGKRSTGLDCDNLPIRPDKIVIHSFNQSIAQNYLSKLKEKLIK